MSVCEYDLDTMVEGNGGQNVCRQALMIAEEAGHAEIQKESESKGKIRKKKREAEQPLISPT